MESACVPSDTDLVAGIFTLGIRVAVVVGGIVAGVVLAATVVLS
jgi:hypothetical protein